MPLRYKLQFTDNSTLPYSKQAWMNYSELLMLYRLAGGNGERYGKGIYFSESSKYSKNFAQAEPTSTWSATTLGQKMYTSRRPFRKMIVARVLVGDYCKGESSFKRPPRIDGERKGIRWLLSMFT